MNIFINSKPTKIDPATTVARLIELQNLPAAGTALAINNRVVPKDRWDTTNFEENCNVTIIRAVCGG